MDPIFRHRMDWLHRWGGLVLGSLLTMIFFMGTLSVYDREIDRWMMPATRLALPAQPLPLDTLRERAAALVDPARDWYVLLPDARNPFIDLVGTKDGVSVSRQLDPATGVALPEARTLGATGFFFPLHYSLMIDFKMIGLFVVAFAGMAMLALLVSGVVIHRGLFKKFFMLRMGPPLRRFSLDLHALTGVVALPFHVAIVVTGLVMFATTTMPAAVGALYGDPATFQTEAYHLVARPPAGHAAPAASLDAMLRQAEQIWGHGAPFYIHLSNPGDAAAVVEMRRSPTDHLGDEGETIFLDGTTGAVLGRATPEAVVHLASVLGGMHLLQFQQSTLRFLYFVAGLAGTVMIATGFIIFAEKRRDAGRHPRLVDALAVGSTLGLLLATAAYLLTNRLVPPLPARPTVEILVFFAIWAGSMIDAFANRGRGLRLTWQLQALVLAALCLVTVMANWATTAVSLFQGPASVAGVDLALLATAAAAGTLALRLRAAGTDLRLGLRRKRA
ncbi:PepSY domain-containing protein [Beijerinckia sp. L45]|uniref:PepSY-associated TM helix domain-containing protein n=1 Tax=Beijerinckia sp. L45 TaxID=1641855 RepID=UPI00131C307F|nr:PepSY-associated TM helix domain-containing protein [Beijerinckia sp. L45]